MKAVEPLLVEIQFQVKTYDIDYAGIVHNAIYFRWLEDLRLKILAENYPLAEMLAEQKSPILERSQITYIRPLRLFDKPLGRMWVSDIRRARWFVEAEFCLDGSTVAEANQSGYFLDLEQYRPIRIPDKLREKWDQAAESRLP